MHGRYFEIYQCRKCKSSSRISGTAFADAGFHVNDFKIRGSGYATLLLGISFMYRIQEINFSMQNIFSFYSCYSAASKQYAFITVFIRLFFQFNNIEFIFKAVLFNCYGFIAEPVVFY